MCIVSFAQIALYLVLYFLYISGHSMKKKRIFGALKKIKTKKDKNPVMIMYHKNKSLFE